MNLGYLDDVSLGGPVDTVAADVALRSFTRVDVGSASLLSAPLFHGSELDKSWSGCCDDPTRAAKRLCDIGC